MAPLAMTEATRSTASFSMLLLLRVEQSAKHVDRARPDQVPVFLGDADVERVVADVLEPDSAPQLHPCGGIFVAKPVQPHPAPRAPARAGHDLLRPRLRDPHPC